MKSNKKLPTKEELKKIRRRILRISYQAGGAHIGGTFSSLEILNILYKCILNIKPDKPDYKERDRFILSKGHSCLGLYIILADLGFFPKKELDYYCKSGGILPGHATITIPGVEASTGSLGHGLAIAAGMALSAKIDNRKWRVFALLSDGDCQEGSTWEAVMSAAHHGLDNLVVIVDYNKLTSFEGVGNYLKSMDPLSEKFRAFGWETREVGGHDIKALFNILSKVPIKRGKPSSIIAKTVKGKGVSFMENVGSWHYRRPTDDELVAALQELQ